MKKSIHIIADYFFPVKNGMEMNIYNTYSYFVKNGWDVTLHTTANTHEKKDILPKKEVINGIKVIRYRSFAYKFKLLLLPIYKNDETICLHDFGIENTLLVYIKCYLLKLIGKKNFRLIFSSHGLFNYKIDFYPGYKMIIRKAIERTIGVFLITNTVDSIRAVSNFEKQGLINAGIDPSLITVITNGLENEAFQYNETQVSKNVKTIVRENPSYLLQVSRIDRVKNFDVSIRALTLLPKDVKFLVVGPIIDKAYKKKLDGLISDLGLSSRVYFIGSYYGRDKYYLMRHAHAVVHMSRAEGYCNSVHEALSQGTVCIVSKDTALEELIVDNENGYCVNPDDYITLAKKIMFTLKDKNEKIILKMKNNNKKHYLNNSWNDIAMRVESLYLNTKYHNSHDLYLEYGI